MKARVLTRQQIYGKVFVQTEREFLIDGKAVEKAVWHAELAAAHAAAKKLVQAGYVHHYDPNA